MLSAVMHKAYSLRSIYHISRLFYLFMMLLFLTACSTSKKAFDPDRKFSPQQLQQDYTLFQNILQERHPGLYWHTPKPVMDSIFMASRQLLTDSMTEYDFRKILMPVVASVQCGHTVVQPSKRYIKYRDTLQNRSRFPFTVKIWNDTAVLISSVYKNSPLQRGDMIDSINGLPFTFLLDTMYHYIPADGNNVVAENQLLSGSAYFGSLYTLLFGWPPQFKIAYKDSLGAQHRTTLKPVMAPKDSVPGQIQKKAAKKEKISKRQRREQQRFLKINEGYALMQLNSFSEKLQLQKFFRRSFKELHRSGIPCLVIDLRLNGGGRVENALFLIKYLADHPFKTADSLYAVTARSKYSRYIKNDFWAKLFIRFSTRNTGGKRYYHYYEHHYFKPRKQHHFNGNVYLLTGGLTYSASVLVLSALKKQGNITIVGEPSGGAAYGSSAWLIPDVTLPNTRVRFRLPLFRMVINKALPKNGQGVLPDVFAGPDIESIRNGIDYKMKKVLELIQPVATD